VIYDLIMLELMARLADVTEAQWGQITVAQAAAAERLVRSMPPPCERRSIPTGTWNVLA
jgi:hypothetical protein